MKEGFEVPQCKAHNRQGGRCRRFAVKGKSVCCLHGGKSTGAKTMEGKERARLANYKHGFFTKQAIVERKKARALMKESLALINSF